ncbi:XP_036356076.1uncharacterized protein LOC118761994 [Octopus vulgaris]|uniref:XP_036356076.1uncharacterized protein LOC118761994 n=1 Tax=Octopus vulgaris TaxID=6645 RepID=A0AA36MIN4_OCTVU|nr:XP_036356076.1uncharacterized protein LOC118761994 [Octopus vulgaris]
MERTPLLEAVSQGHLGMTHLLIALGANVNAVDGEGNSCLHLAMATEKFNSEGAPLDLLNECCTALNLKMEERLSGIVVARYLASKGADLHHKNNKNNTPLDLIKDPNLRKKKETCLPPQCLRCRNKAATTKVHPCGHLVICKGCSNVPLQQCLKCLKPVITGRGRVDDHYMQIPRFDCKSIMKSHSSKFRPLCPAVSKILQLTDSDNDSKNLVTVSRIVEICNGIVTYSPDLKLISCATTGGDFDFHCSSNVTDMTRIENETLKLLIVGKKAVFFYKIIRKRGRSVLPSEVKTPSNLYGYDGGPYSIEMIPNILLSQGKTQSNLYSGRIDKMCVHLIDNSRMFAVNEHDLLVKDHVTRSQINMFIDLVDVFSRNISLSEMLSSRLYLQDLTVSDKAHEVVVPQSFGDRHPVEIGCLVITENNLVALYDSTNENIKILTFDVLTVKARELLQTMTRTYILKVCTRLIGKNSPVSRLQTNNFPVQVKDIDISDEGKTAVCEMANSGNVKLFDEDGKLLCYRDFGSFVGGVCFTGERNILVTVPNRQEIFQLKSQNLEKYKVWESRVPYGIIWRKVGNIYWCVHINMIECDTIKIDGDQLKVLESMSLSNIDFGLHFPSITSKKNKGMFSNELFNKLKNGGDGGERSTSRKIEVRRGNYIAESMLGIDEISVRRLPHRTAMFPLSFSLSGLLDSNSMFCFLNAFKLIMLQDNSIVVLLYKCTLMVTSGDGHLLYSQTFEKEAQDICQWTDESFVVLFRDDKQLIFFDTDLCLLKKITTEKPYNLMYKKNANNLVCVFEDAPNECSNIPYVTYADILHIGGEMYEYKGRVNLGKEGKVVAMGVTSNEDIVVLKYKEDHYDVCWYRDNWVRSQQLMIQGEEPFPNIFNKSLTIHGENIYISDFNNNIHQVSVDSKCEIFLSSQEIEVCHIKAIHVSDYFIMIYGNLDNRFDGLFYYER